MEPWDDLPADVEDYEDELNLANMHIEEKLKLIKNETGKKVIAKLTSRSDIVQAEMSKRKDHRLSRHYVPAILSVHHTIQHAAYSEAMAEPSYCITMEGADTTAENLLLDSRKSGGGLFSKEHLKSIAIALLHIHDRGLVHGDFGSHNTAKFGDRWKILGISGSVVVGQKTNPKRGFYHPPEAVLLETRNVSLGEKNVGAAVVEIPAAATFDVWAFGTIIYEALAGLPLSPYRSAYKAKRAMTTAELFKVGQWDDRSLRKALRHISDENAQDLIKNLLHPNPELRAQTMREALGHPYFGLEKLEGNAYFDKPQYTESAQPVALKIYSDDYMKKMGWTDEDVAELFAPKDIYPPNDFIIEEEGKDEEPNPAEDKEPEMMEDPSEDDSVLSATPQISSHDESVSYVSSPARSSTASGDVAADKSTKPATAPETPAKASSVAGPHSMKETSTAACDNPVQKAQPPPAPAPPLTSLSTPQNAPAAKTKSKFSVKGLKSKFGKK